MNLYSLIKKEKAAVHNFLRWMAAVSAHMVCRSFFWIPVKKNRIVLHVHRRKGYTCNPKYIANAIRKQYPDKFEIYWATDYPESVQDLNSYGIIPLKMNTWRFWITVFCAKVIITNDHLPACYLKRKQQYLINTWHASGAYKKIGFSIHKKYGYFESRIFEYEHKGADLVMSGCQTFSDVMPEAFHLPKRIFQLTGMARNDIFFRNNMKIKDALYRKYSIPLENHIVLYAPTFRGNANTPATTYNLDYKRVINALQTRFGGSWTCLYRAHYFYQSFDCECDTINVTDYPDIQELLVAADALITDYSSCIWDYSLTHRPSFIYATDLEDYMKEDRDFYTPISEWPYPLAQNNDELEQNILSFNQIQYESKVKVHQRKLGMFETGHASETAANKIYKLCYK
jgi:CDP-glycerol glycerophosphotransferase